MTDGKLQSRFGFGRAALQADSKEQRLAANIHQKAVTNFERKTFTFVSETERYFGGYKS